MEEIQLLDAVERYLRNEMNPEEKAAFEELRVARVGRMQPHVAGNWNPQGYGGNAMHRIAVLVG